ncbi:hypothetical protein HYQ45_018822 [Verticillium longisporum]|uniref:Uncharacterized protein n=1 Tax=Verticillium longisporum TaxID=100787 RepID=A0A8I2ZZ92_VERLO|nr:hypothetical protein HYQ45_018822 [Verticillium longisporum]
MKFSLQSLLGASALLASAADAQQLAFPGAEGFGRFATGGRTGSVYKVTNLNHRGRSAINPYAFFITPVASVIVRHQHTTTQLPTRTS